MTRSELTSEEEKDCCTHEALELPDDRDEGGRACQYPVRIRCPSCGEKVTVSRWRP